MSDIYTTLRVIDVVLYALIVWGFWRRRNRFAEGDTQDRSEKVGLGLLIITGAYASIESLLTGVPGGPRVFVVTVPLVFLAVAEHMDVARRVRDWWQGRRV